MNTKALRQKILDLAIHGKLVPQNPNDEGATVLLEKIRAEKAEKIKKGELKADKKDSFIFTKECEFDEDKLGKCSSGTRHKRHYEQFADGSVKDIEDEIPFDVPDGWAWCRLTNVAITELGKTLDAKKNKGESYDYLCALNVKWYTFDFTTMKQIRLEEKEKERYLVRKGDLLICEGGDVGRSAIWESDNPIYYQNALHRVRFYQNINQYFFLHVLNYYKNIGLIDDVSGGVTIKHFTQNSMQKLLFPLPPLVEQERIVSVIKSIFSQIDTLDQNKSDLQTAINKTKSKILDLAIHGKLVPQDPNDEPAEELLKRIATSDNRPYKKLSGDEIPFELPKTWIWQKLPDLCSIPITDGTHKTPTYSDKENGIPFLSSKDVTSGEIDWSKIKYITKELHEELYKRLAPQKNDILLAKNGTTGIAALVKDNTVFDIYVTLALIRPISKIIYPQYLLYIINSQFCKNQFNDHLTGIGVPNLHLVDINKTVIPLPPLSEQQRIVLKIEELFKYTDIININIKDC